MQVVPAIGRDFGVQIPTATEAALSFDSATLDALVRIDGATYGIAGASQADSTTLSRIGTRNLPKVCWTLARYPTLGPTQNLTMQIHEFPTSLGWAEQLDIAVDDVVVDDVRKKGRRL